MVVAVGGGMVGIVAFVSEGECWMADNMQTINTISRLENCVMAMVALPPLHTLCTRFDLRWSTESKILTKKGKSSRKS